MICKGISLAIDISELYVQFDVFNSRSIGLVPLNMVKKRLAAVCPMDYLLHNNNCCFCSDLCSDKVDQKNSKDENKTRKNRFHSGNVTNGSVQIHFLESGVQHKNKTYDSNIVLVPGIGLTSTCFTCVMNGLSELGYYCLAIDPRGFGLSSKPTVQADFSFSLFVSDVYAVISSQRVQHPTLIGHSFATTTVGDYWSSYSTDPLYSPSRLGFMGIGPSTDAFLSALLAAAGLTGGTGSVSAIAGVLEQYSFTDVCKCDSQERLQKAYRILGEEPLTGTFQSFQLSLIASDLTTYPPLTTILSTVTVPVLFITGSDDQVCPPSSTFAAAAVTPNAFVHEIRGSGHLSMTTHYKIDVQAIDEFIKSQVAPCSLCFAHQPTH